MIAASICIRVESSPKPFSEVIIPELNFKSLLSSKPKGYPATIIRFNFLGEVDDMLIKLLFLTSAFNKAKSKNSSFAINFALIF